MKHLIAWLLLSSQGLAPSASPAEESPLAQPWNYAEAMKQVARRGSGRPGVVLHVGDSITYANPYGQWARAGRGRSDDDRAALAWMHAGADDDTDGWWLARADHPDGGRSYTACGGIRADEMLVGGKNGMPSLASLLEKYRPQVVVLMLGTNDASAGRDVAVYRADMEKAVDLMLGRGVVVIPSTIPPHPGRPALARSYNEALRFVAEARKLPLIDYEREILKRRPDDWDGSLLVKGDLHPTADRAGVTPTSAPTEENLRESGYLLRGWLSVRKIAEVRRAVFPERGDPARHGAIPKRGTPWADRALGGHGWPGPYCRPPRSRPGEASPARSPAATMTRAIGRSSSSCGAAATMADTPRRPTPTIAGSRTRSSATWRP